MSCDCGYNSDDIDRVTGAVYQVYHKLEELQENERFKLRAQIASEQLAVWRSIYRNSPSLSKELKLHAIRDSIEDADLLLAELEKERDGKL